MKIIHNPVVLLDGKVVPGCTFADEDSGVVQYAPVDSFTERVIFNPDNTIVMCEKKGLVTIISDESYKKFTKDLRNLLWWAKDSIGYEEDDETRSSILQSISSVEELL